MEEEDELLLPREKLLRNGVTPLTDDELLALFLRTGTPGKTVFTQKSCSLISVHCMAC